MKFRSAVGCVLLWGLVSGCAGRQRMLETGARLPINRVVLFQNGLGYFERSGPVDRDEIEIRTRREAVDDVLKSLTVVDNRGGQVTSVRVLSSDKDSPTVGLHIDMSRAAQHDVMMAYMTEASGWRPSYRVLIQPAGKVRMQGLAVVDNHSGESWHDVSLSLSTEIPISFRYALRDARAAHRAEFDSDGRLRRPDLAATAAQTQQGVGQQMNMGNQVQGNVGNTGNDLQDAYNITNTYLPRPARRSARPVNRKQTPTEGEGEEPPTQTSAVETPQVPSVDPLTALESMAADRGFVIEGHSRFSLDENESGLVPFLDEITDGRLVLLYKPASSTGPSQIHPYRAVLWKNPLAAPLLIGPVAVYGSGRFMGDGVCGLVPAHEQAFVPFALDSSLSVKSRTEEAESEVRALSLIGGQLRVEITEVRQHMFEFESAATWNDLIYAFTPDEAGWTPRELPPGTVHVPAGWYVPLEAAGPKANLNIAKIRKVNPTVNIAADPYNSYVPALLSMMVDSPTGTPIVPRLKTIVDRLAAIRDQRQRLDEDLTVHEEALAQRRMSLFSLREVPASDPLRRRLAAGIAQGITQVEEITRKTIEISTEQVALRQEWYDLLRNLSIDTAAAQTATPPAAHTTP